MPRRARTVAAAVAFFLLVGAVSWHQLSRKLAPAETRYPGYETWALRDFRGNLYYPTHWFLAGGNPYDGTSVEVYGVQRFPPYSPAIFVAHWPFALLPFGTSRLIWYAMIVLATLPLAALALRLAGRRPDLTAVFVVATLICLSRPGLWALLLGQYTVPLTLATYAALAYSETRPWLAALALAYTTIKPTFAIPIFALLLVGGHWRLVWRGLGLAAIATLPVVAVMAVRAGGLRPLLQEMATTVDAFSKLDDVAAGNFSLRIDVSDLLARLGVPLGSMGELTVALVVFTVGALALATLRNRPRAEPYLPATIFVLTILLSTYHNAYDLVLVTWPLAAALLATHRGPLAWATVVGLALPAMNFAATGTVFRLLHVTANDPLGRLIFASNALVLTALFVLTTGTVLGRAGRARLAASSPA